MDLNKLKTEYENIKADDRLKERIEETMRKENSKRKMLRGIVGTAACVTVLTVSLNVSPTFAYAMSNIPVVDSIVKVLTLNKYEVDEGNYNATVVTPKLEGLVDKELEEKLNAEFKENAEEVIAAFEKSIKELTEDFGEGNFHEGIEYNYNVKTDNENMLALDVYLYGASGSSWIEHTYYNIDKKTGELLTFEGLFKDDVDYITPISEYIKGEMERLNKEEGGMYFLPENENNFEGFEKIEKDQKFYINDDGNIVICFDKYEVAAGAQGSPEFVLPDEVVKDIVK
ncbi:DUF3298 domain-containing protein [Anaerotignum faecicola]|nr:DUF3298 domain-containing protein [Anaerotignum faecicola]